jgi:hypothetical protein
MFTWAYHWDQMHSAHTFEPNFPTHLILLNLITLIVFGEAHKMCINIISENNIKFYKVLVQQILQLVL